ncbi:MAG: hypothetical protein JXA37_06290 [Chloroflexia bacterium]|nr:hypothetical protein [Chloroflexia bacterium]
MPSVVSVRLRRQCRIYDFGSGEFALSPGEWVIVETNRGRDTGQVVTIREALPHEPKGKLKDVVRRANSSDLRRMERNREKEQEVLQQAQEAAKELELPMRLIAAEYTYNGRYLTIYFTAEKRVDFRELVRRLARNLRTRIDLRQVGARDEARLLGGIGPCGRPLCCETFLCNFQRISVRMAKEQDLPLNPMKISGLCGRLLCCLSYEYDQYREIKSQLPDVGDQVTTLSGQGKVVGLSVPKEAATVELRPGLTVEIALEELNKAAQLEAEGKLQARQPSYAEFIETTPQKEPAPPKKKKRRRRKKSQPAQQPAAKQEAVSQRSRSSSSRSRKKPSRQQSQKQSGQQPASKQSPQQQAPKQSPQQQAQKGGSGSSSRRRRPRRRDSPEKKRGDS